MVGPSLGGMTALAYAILFPDEVDNLVTISGAARATPFAIAIRSVQREAIRTDPEWKGGEYVPAAGPVTGLRLARKLGLITYRSAAEWRQRFGRERGTRGPRRGRPFGIEFEVEAYLESTRASSWAPSTRTATCTSRARWTCSTWRSTADRWRRGWPASRRGVHW